MSYPKIYDSKYTDSKITGPQLIVERICEKLADRKKKTLIQKFWSSKEWGQIFRKEIVFANRLLSIYPVEVILKALKDKDAWSVNSLISPKLPELCDKYNKEIENPELYIAPTDQLPKSPKSFSLLNKLIEHDEKQ